MSLIAVQPPEFFPRPEYYALMAAVDDFVLTDTFQYSRQSFQNRARVRTPDGWSWMSIPLKGGQHGRAVCDVRVDDRDKRWPIRHWRTLEYNYRSSPFFEFYEDTVADVLKTRRDFLAGYTVGSVRSVRQLLSIDTEVVEASSLASRPSGLDELLAIYPGADLITLSDAEAFESRSAGVLEWALEAYPQNFPGWEPGMSALDMLFNLGPSSTERLGDCGIRAPRRNNG